MFSIPVTTYPIISRHLIYIKQVSFCFPAHSFCLRRFDHAQTKAKCKYHYLRFTIICKIMVWTGMPLFTCQCTNGKKTISINYYINLFLNLLILLYTAPGFILNAFAISSVEYPIILNKTIDKVSLFVLERISNNASL